MKLLTTVTRIGAVALALPLLLSGAASAQTGAYPSKPVRLIVPAAPGGGADFLARIVGTKLQEQTGQSFVIDNRAGASGTIAADLTAKSPADGYTMLLGQSTSMAIAPHLYAKLPYDTLRDLRAVTLVAEVPNMLVVHPSVPAKTVKELIALAKAKPGTLNFGSSGNGAPSHLAGEMFKGAAGVDMVHVPYKGAGPSVNALLAGQIQVMFAPMVAVLPQVKAGRLTALAVTSAKRSSAVPELPTLIESGLDSLAIVSWFGFFVPAATPQAVVDKLYQETVKALKAADTAERFAKEGAEPSGMSPADFTSYVAQESARYAKVLKDNGIKLD
ncbi:MAG: tripartite tricarboxylate transporter substrate binding protein [Rubrivivax sp.]|nr:tripartite tricarboxylate transporter substrate binding protein [Rubrivivax sp.]